MLALYGLYILIMIHNEALKKYVTSKLLSNPVTAKLISTGESLDGSDEVFVPKSEVGESSSFFDNKRNYQITSLMDNDGHIKTVEDDAIFMAALLIIIKYKKLFRSQLRFCSASRYIIITRQHKAQRAKAVLKQQASEANYFGPETGTGSKTSHQERMAAYARDSALSKNKFSIVSKEEHEFWNMPPDENDSKLKFLSISLTN